MSLARRGQGIDSTRAMVSCTGYSAPFIKILLSSMIANAAQGIAIPRQTHAAGIEDRHTVDLDVELEVSVAHAHDVGIHVLEPLGPGDRVLEEVLVKRIPGGGVDQQKAPAGEREPLGHRQLQQVAPLLGPQPSHIDGREDCVRYRNPVSPVTGIPWATP